MPHPSEKPILLMGLRGSGKSTLGRSLADKLGATFADLDDLVRAHFGADSVKAIWDAHGEQAFREQEAAQLKHLIHARTPAAQESAPLVLALGGGAPTAPGAAELLERATNHKQCVLIYLNAEPSTLAARIAAGDPDRPSLTGDDPVREIAKVHAQRHPLYARLATHSIDASGSKEQVLERIIRALDQA